MGWTPQLYERLKELWNGGMKAREICLQREFRGCTRNAILGMLFRLRAKDPSVVRSVATGRRSPRRKRVRMVRVVNKSKPPQPVVTYSAPASLYLGLLELPLMGCRFIVSSQANRVPTHLYCGLDASAFARQDGFNCYCGFHQRLMRARHG